MNYTRLFDIIYHQKETFPQNDCLVGFENGTWKKYSTDEVIGLVNQFSRALIADGIQAGDKIAIIANNRPEYNIVDLGCLQAGAIDVPLYPTISSGEYEYIMNDAEVKLVFVSDEEILGRVKAIQDKVPTLKAVYTFEQISGAEHWSGFMKKGEDTSNQDEVERRKDAVKAEDLATLIYTSGTTGMPKGVMLSHDNITANVRDTLPCLPINHEHKCLSFLPLCHVFERMVTYTYMACGASIYYAESLETIGDNLKEIKPHFFTSVPRLLEKVYDKILAKGNEVKGIKKALFFWALKLGHKYKESNNGFFYSLQLSIARALVFSKWRAALGGNIVGIVTGAAALQERLGRVFTAAGIDVREGYGLTETSPVLSFNRFEKGQFRFGTVGIPIPSVEIKIAEDGEILAKGPNIMMGYYKKPEATAEVLDADGWFHTGDIGMFDPDGFLKITDRKKELFKTSGGKYVAPQPLENKFKESKYIEQIMVVGNNEKFVGALFVPAPDALTEFCKSKGISTESMDEMIRNKAVEELYQGICDEFNPEFSHVEQIKKFSLVPNEWTVEGGELTPTMKVKRRAIMEKYERYIREIYENS